VLRITIPAHIFAILPNSLLYIRIVITTQTQPPPSILNCIAGWALPNTRQTFQDMVGYHF
jgi:hypothetical protein